MQFHPIDSRAAPIVTSKANRGELPTSDRVADWHLPLRLLVRLQRFEFHPPAFVFPTQLLAASRLPWGAALDSFSVRFRLVRKRQESLALRVQLFARQASLTSYFRHSLSEVELVVSQKRIGVRCCNTARQSLLESLQSRACNLARMDRRIR